MKRWRTIPNALKELKEFDPRVGLTYYSLRKMVKEGTISHLRNGRYLLININEILGDIKEVGTNDSVKHNKETTENKTLTVKEAANFLGCTEEFICCGLEQGTLPIGSAIRIGGWSYHISHEATINYMKGLSHKHQQD